MIEVLKNAVQPKHSRVLLSLMTAATLAVVAGCGGGSSATSNSSTGGAISGVIATGAPMATGTVTVFDVDGKSGIDTLEPSKNGSYSISIDGMKAPFFLKAEGKAAGSSDTVELYAIALLEENQTANLNPLTNYIVAELLGVPSVDSIDRTVFQSKSSTLAKSYDTVIGTVRDTLKPVYGLCDTCDPMRDIYTLDSDLDAKIHTIKLAMKNDTLEFSVLKGDTLEKVDDPTALSQTFPLTLLHLNDTHANLEPISTVLRIDGTNYRVNLGGFPQLVSTLDSLKKFSPNPLILHAGDIFQGTLYFTQHKGLADAWFLNKIVDAMAIGNHEFDLGNDALATFLPHITFPALSANITFDTSDAADDTSEFLAKNILPYVIKTIAGKEVGIIGLTTETTANIANPGSTVTFHNYIEKAQQYVNELKGKGINKIIVLSHLGFESEKTLAHNVADIDVIIGGHSHELLGGTKVTELGLTSKGEYPTVIDSGENRTLLVQAWEHGKTIGELRLLFDANGKVLSYSGSPLFPYSDTVEQQVEGVYTALSGNALATFNNTTAPNTALRRTTAQEADLAKLAEFQTDINALKAQVIGTAADSLYHVRIPGMSHSAAGVLGKGSLIAPHVADAMLWKSRSVGQAVDIAIQNAGGVRIDIPAGNITVATAYTLLPFGNSLSTFDLRGADLIEAMKTPISNALKGTSTGAFPYVSGMRYTVVADDSGEVQTIAIEIQDSQDTNQYTPLDPQKTYRIATNGYTASGGDYYTVFRDSSENRLDPGFIDAEVFMEYVQEQSKTGGLKELPFGRVDLLIQPKETAHVLNAFRSASASALVPALRLDTVDTYATGQYDESAAEIPAFDPHSKRLFVVNAQANRVDVLQMSDNATLTLVDSLDFGAHGTGVNSVAVHAFGQNSLAVAAVENKNDSGEHLSGKAVFFNPANGTVLAACDAGALPDMATFTPDGTMVLIANEGEPSPDYSYDPEGSVTLVDISSVSGNNYCANVTQIGFSAFNSQKEALRAQGVRLYGANNATVAEDVEPEYIAVSADSETAWVALQENNAFAMVDLATKTVTAIKPLGVKDHSLPQNALDISRDNAVSLRTWPLFGLYMPDAIHAYQAADGKTYIVSANEGDAREYSTYEDITEIGKVTLASQFDGIFGSSASKLAITPAMRDTNDGTGKYAKLYTFGSRSFSIWNDSVEHVFDSGKDFELITGTLYPSYFNASNTNNTLDHRSVTKGPEPEGVAIGTIGEKTYAFVGLERIGGVMVYDVTNPQRAAFVTYVNNRNFTQATSSGNAGDLGPEGLIFIPAAQSPNGKNLLVVANEVSGTTTVFEVSAQ